MFWDKKQKKNETIEKIKNAVSSDNKENVFDLDIDKIFGPMPKKEKPNIDKVQNTSQSSYNLPVQSKSSNKLNNISNKGTIMTAPKNYSGQTHPDILKKEIKKEISPSPLKETEERKNAPPVFIKLARYDEIINRVNSLKHSISNVYEILNVLEKLEKSKRDVLDAFKTPMKKINDNIEFLNTILVKPSGLGIKPKKIVSENMDKSLIQLKKEIEEIKTLLKKSL